jgi:hypothetical protein
MALQFGHNVAVEYARVYLYRLYIYRCKKHAFTLLRPIDGAGFQRKACGAFTANGGRCDAKKSSSCRYIHEMSLVFHNKHVVTARVTYV